jgi:hypothetical protein
VVVQGSVGRLRGEILHYAYPDIATWVEKHNRYSNWEAAVETRGICNAKPPTAGAPGSRRQSRKLARRLPFRPTLRFLYAFVFRCGFLDGYAGYALSRLMATYELLSVLKAREARHRSNEGP